MLITGVVFVGWPFCFLVFLALSGSEVNMVIVYCLVENYSGILIGTVTGFSK